jgi:hypothetical protein
MNKNAISAAVSTNMYVGLLVSVCNIAAGWLSGYLVAHHYLPEDQMDGFTMDLAKHLILWAPFAAAIAVAAWKNLQGKKAYLTGLMPWIDTEDKLKAQMKTGVTPALHTPSDTVPGVPNTAVQRQIRDEVQRVKTQEKL